MCAFHPLLKLCKHTTYQSLRQRRLRLNLSGGTRLNVVCLKPSKVATEEPKSFGGRGLNSLTGRTSLRIPFRPAFVASSGRVDEAPTNKICLQSLDE